MSACTVRPPQNLPDFVAILTACGGPGWAQLAMLGLITVIVAALAVTLLLWALRGVGR